MSNSPGDTRAPPLVTSPAGVSKVTGDCCAPSTRANPAPARQARNWAGVDPFIMTMRPLEIATVVSRPASRNGTGCSISASSTVNIAVLTPMPSASMATDSARVAGCDRRRRAARPMSSMNDHENTSRMRVGFT